MKAYISIAFFLLASIVQAQNTYSGEILDNTNLPIPYANVLALNETEEVIAYVFSDDNGNFRLSIPQDKSIVKLKISLLGYEDKIIPIEEISSFEIGTIQLNVSSANLDEVVITAERPLIERQPGKLVVNVDKSITTVGNTAFELLEKSPGININLDGSINLRGRSGVMVMVNGKRQMMSGDQLMSYLSGLPGSAIEKIELIHQPSAEFDAEGTGGIVNIVLKNLEVYGSKGSVNLSAGRGIKNRSSAGISYGYKNEKFSVNTNLNYNYLERYVNLKTDRNYTNTNTNSNVLFSSDAISTVPSKNILLNGQLSYSISPKLDIGADLQFSTRFDNQEGNGQTDIYENVFTGGFLTDSGSKTENKNYTISPFLEWKLNQSKTLKFDATFAKYTNESDQNYTTAYFDENQQFYQDDLLMGDIIGNLNLSAFKLDYNFDNEDFGAFSTGVKVSNVKNDNDLFYTNLIDDEIVINEALTNHFIYKENIQAAYLDWKMQIDKWSLQVGLRAENTRVEGNQLLSGDNFEQNYLQWFPTAFIQYQKDENNIFGFNTGRRINRPNYGQLNPFRFFVDINTFRSGNPRLQPEKTWNFEFSYNYKSFLDLALSYSTTKDNILFVIQQNDETRTTNVLPVNIGLYNYLGLNVSTQIKFWSWWNNRMNVELFYNEFLGDVTQYELNNKAFAFRVNGNSSLKFTNNFTGEISYFYQPKYQYGISDFNPRWRIDLALQQKILKGDGRIRLAVTDIFYKHSPTGSTDFGNINETFESLRDTRVVTIGFQYNFGNSNLKSTKKETDAAKEELNRIS